MSTIFDFFDPRSTTSPFLQKSFPNLRLNKSTEKFWQIPKSPKSLSKLYISRVLSKVKPSTPSIARFFHKERGGRKRVDERHGEKRGLYTLGSCLRYERPLSGRGLEARKRFTMAVRPPRGLYSTPIESRSSWCHVAFSTKAKRSQLFLPRVPFITISLMQSVPRELTRTNIFCRPSLGRR